MKRLTLAALCFLLFPLLVQAQWRPAYPSGRLSRGVGAPSHPTVPCNSATDVGNVYVRSDTAAALGSLYLCVLSAPSTYTWELQAAGSAPTFTSVQAGFFSTDASNPASTGLLRAANNTNIFCARNATNSADLCVKANTSNEIEFTGLTIRAASLISTGSNPINVTNIAGDAGSPSNGDIWYNTSTNKFRCRENSSTVNCIGSSSSSLPSPGSGFYFTKNFFNCVNSGTDLTINQALSGGGLANVTPPPSANWVGGCQLNTSGSTSGQATIRTQTSGGVSRLLLFGGGAWNMSWYVRSDANLSDGTNTYRYHIGFLESFGSATPTDGVFFRYTDGVNSGKWQCVHANNSTETTADSGVTVATSTNYKLNITVNPAGTATTFAINGTTVCGSMAQTNIPTSAGREVGFGAMILKSAGTTQRNLNVMAFEISHTYTTAW